MAVRRDGFHRLAIEDAPHVGQRPKLEDDDRFTSLVVYRADPDAADRSGPSS